MSGFTIIEADSMEAVRLIAKACPFLVIGGSLKVSGLIQMPGQKQTYQSHILGPPKAPLVRMKPDV